ncbi:hypothetical protein JCM19238_5398 [Vibrio ponticus]|nr:hypothetical protein JCM19238_5398 [Vibrio ponticus]
MLPKHLAQSEVARNRLVRLRAQFENLSWHATLMSSSIKASVIARHISIYAKDLENYATLASHTDLN